MNNFAKKNMILVIFVISLISFANIKNCFGESYTTSLSYGDNFTVSSDKEIGKAGGIKWEFTGSNLYVGITVRIYDDYNYLEFLDGNTSAQRYVVSDGTYYIASGIWSPPKNDVWHIVFIHLCSSKTEITSVNIDVIFVTGALAGGLLAVIIAVPIVFNIAIVVLVVFLIKRKKKQQVPVSPQQDPQTSPASNVRYCKDCGQENIDVSTYCKKCGSKMDE